MTNVEDFEPCLGGFSIVHDLKICCAHRPKLCGWNRNRCVECYHRSGSHCCEISSDSLELRILHLAPVSILIFIFSMTGHNYVSSVTVFRVVELHAVDH